MRIVVIAVGKMKDRAAEEIALRYQKRLPRGVRLEWIEVPAAPGKGDPKKALAQEAAAIRERIPERARVVALSERGREMDSMAFAKWLGGLRDAGRDLCLLIGGQDGLDPSLSKAAAEVLSLSRLTFPHELTRAILAEQLYRAFSILHREPYHRE